MTGRYAAVIATFVTACGRIGFEGIELFDADTGRSDSGVDAMPPFGPPTPVAMLNTTDIEDDPSLTADLLEIYFASDRPGGQGMDIWRSSRMDPAGSWNAPSVVAVVNSTSEETAPYISRDGLVLWFGSYRLGELDIWMSTRPNRTAAWSLPTVVDELRSADVDSGPTTDATATLMIMNRGPASATLDLYASERASAQDVWSVPVPLTGFATAADDAGAWLSADGTVIYFASNRAGGLGGRDLYRATRSAPSAIFGNVVPLVEINTAGTDSDPWISDDERFIWFAGGGMFGGDIYEASR